jgi:uroporphyrinogen-III synthase
LLVESLRAGTIVCRGPKPAAVLKRYGVTANLSAASPYTSGELLVAMADMPLADTEITVVHYGERNGALAAELRLRCAQLHELCLYEWRLPDDIGPLQDMAHAIVNGDLDAVIFTSQVQWKHLLRVASDVNLETPLKRALNAAVIVAAVGPICSAALRAEGVQAHVVPGIPKMGALVAAVADYFGCGRR